MNLNDLSHIPYSELSKELEKGGEVCLLYIYNICYIYDIQKTIPSLFFEI